jgi:hypothetical protein
MPDMLWPPALSCTVVMQGMFSGSKNCCSVAGCMRRAPAKFAASMESSSPQEQVSSSYKQMGDADVFLLMVLPSCTGGRVSRRAPAALTNLANSSLRPNLPAGADWRLLRLACYVPVKHNSKVTASKE